MKLLYGARGLALLLVCGFLIGRFVPPIARGMILDTMTYRHDRSMEGFLVPAFRQVDQCGQPWDQTQLRGKHTVILFSSLNCGSGGAYIPGMQRLYQQYRGRVQFVCVLMGDDLSILDDFVAVNQLPGPVLIDPDWREPDRNLIWNNQLADILVQGPGVGFWLISDQGVVLAADIGPNRMGGLLSKL